jgi:glycosyltransferase involved in cell wall biosynthesis
MKKVLLIIPSMAFAGGAEKLVDSLAGLLKVDYEISIASFDPPGTKPYFQNDVQFYPLGDGPKLPLILRVFTYQIAAQRISNLKRELGIDVAISVLWRADLINVLSRCREKIMSLSVINLLNNDTNAMMVKLRGLVGFVFRRFDRILAIAPEIATELSSLYRLNPNKVGIFKTFLAPPKALALFTDNRPRFVFCARAVYEKNLDGLLSVFARFVTRNPGRQLVIIGDGPLLVDMRALAIKLGLTVGTQVSSDAQVLFVGSSTTPEAFMAGARAFLLTSRHEGVPTVAILAAALGLPILAADCRGGGMRVLFNLPPDIPLSDPESEEGPSAGLLLPIPESTLPDTIEVWVRAMEVADRNQAQRDKWARGAIRLVAERSPESVRQEWISAIESVSTS